ncbi:MAG: HD domain-containing protein [Thermoanaerobaculia bacterium]|nr:HD domain-containing protein [Thermoanaerobaculia bacterium]
MGRKGIASKISLRHLILLLILVSGLIPLATGALLLTRLNTRVLERQEQSYLTRASRVLSEDISSSTAAARRQFDQLGNGLLLLPGPEDLVERLQQPEAQRYLANFVGSNQDWVYSLNVFDRYGEGPSLGVTSQGAILRAAVNQAFERALREGVSSYGFVRNPDDNSPLGVLAQPISIDSQGRATRSPRLILVGIIRLDLLEKVFQREAEGEVSVFLIGPDGGVLWAEGADERTSRAVGESALVRDFERRPLNMTSEYELFVQGKKLNMVGRVSPVSETGWGVVVQKPLAAAYTATKEVVRTALLSVLILLFIALAVGTLAAQKFGAPFQRLAESSHEIAGGNFGQRVNVMGPGKEIANLAQDFNLMSEYVERYVADLQAAAEENEQLFINSIRAFAAAVDAKDPYTRGHSERVASYSRTIADHLGQSEEFLHRIWIAGVLHDVGKIGIEDKVLKKGGVLTSEEYDEMKLHPVIGFDILQPIGPLAEMLPAVRWHHEAWNGQGYPDGLKGESIPLIARIVAVADTFDAITTNRPYQTAYTPDYAVETITKLTGSRFDAKVVTAFLRAFEQGAIEGKETEPPPSSADLEA